MDFLPEEISKYAEEFTSPESELLYDLNRETWSKMIVPRMLSGHLQGRLLSMLSKMIRPERILEIGTFTGYSALCLAEGLQAKGLLYTLDINEEFELMARKFIDRSGSASKIKLIHGNAVEIIPGIDEVFDLVFIDADKENYSVYYDLVFEKVRSGGFIMADNVLWSGKVLSENPDAETIAISDFNKKVKNDKRVEHLLLPVRDGLMLCRKL